MKVKVKWERQILSDLDLNIEESPTVFKNKLCKITGIPPERQKLLLKGIIVKDSWSNVSLTPNCQLLLLGSKEALPGKPSTQTVFLEDMTEAELSKASNLPPGLSNLGNTCYLNATLQCLRTIPELRTALKEVKGTFQHHEVSKHNLVFSLRDQYELMDKGLTAPPVGLLRSLHTLLPQFSEKEISGKWRQQDANEFWLEIVNILNEVFLQESSSPKNVINQFLSGTFEVCYVCIESELEPQVTIEERFYQLSYFINSDTKFLQLGLEANLIETMTKHSLVLGRDAVFKKICKIKRLPAYLTVQLVRFFYKEKDNINAKVLRDIKFPLLFDAYQLCTPELQEKLSLMREKIKKAEEEKKAPAACVVNPFSFEEDPGSSNSGLYQLRGVLTHKGRSSSSGHYVAWVYDGARWLMCDDAEVIVVPEEAVLKLSGGGDWHTAYILLYGPRFLMMEDPSPVDISS